MSKIIMPSYICQDCSRFRNWGKFNCKKCSHFYTSERKTKYLSAKQIKRIKKKNSPSILIEVYEWLRSNVFPSGYIPSSKCIIFEFGKTFNGYHSHCNKDSKIIRIGQVHKGEALYKIMIHEALHLRLPHHKKSFKEKENELYSIFENKKSLINQ
jgi:hypothetical protein